MTDAERWRRIAAHLEAKPGDHGDFLCWYLDGTAQTYFPPCPAKPAHAVANRMRLALRIFTQFEHDACAEYCSMWNDDDHTVNRDCRIVAACFLSAMADADGGNHKEATP